MNVGFVAAFPRATNNAPDPELCSVDGDDILVHESCENFIGFQTHNNAC